MVDSTWIAKVIDFRTYRSDWVWVKNMIYVLNEQKSNMTEMIEPPKPSKVYQYSYFKE